MVSDDVGINGLCCSPVSAILGDGGAGDRIGVGPGWLGWLTPLVAAYCVTVAALIFRAGLCRYESAGN